MYIRVLDIRVLDDKEKEMLQLIESDEETWKAFKFLVNIVKRNYPWYNNPKREVLKKMVRCDIQDLDGVQQFILNLYHNEEGAGSVFKPV